jgi:hypothetical protein
MPLGIDNGSALITWDWWYGAEFRDNVGDGLNYKVWQVRMDDRASQSGGQWWTHVTEMRPGRLPGTLGTAYDSLRSYDNPWPRGVVDREPYSPPGVGATGGRTFTLYPSRWTRYWIEIRLFQPPEAFAEWSSEVLGGEPLPPNSADPQGRWHMVSMWIADEEQGPVRTLFRAPWVVTRSQIGSFEFEFNTSAKPPAQTGPLVGYGRNVVVLRNYQLPSVPEEDSELFARPAP